MLKRKFIIIGVLIATLLFVMTSCGDKDNPYSGIKFDDYIKLGKYKGLPSIKMPVEISEKDIDQAIDAKLGESSEEHMVKKGSVKKDDIANIDFEGRVNGKKFEGGTSKGYDLKIGSNSFIQGFEKQLIGKKIGSTVNVKVTFPKNYGNDKLAGKKAVFKVKINSVKKVKKPKLTDAFVKKHSKKSKTVAEYKKEVKADLKTKRLQANKEQQKTVMWSQIVSSTKIKKDKKGREMYPEERLKSVDKRNYRLL